MRRAVVAVVLGLVAAALPVSPAGAAAGDVTVVVSGLEAPGGVAAGPDGTIYVTADGALYRVAPGSSTAALVTSGLSAPRGVTVLDGDVYVAEAGLDRVVRVDGADTFTAVMTSLDAPTGLAADGTRLLVADTNGGMVLEWTPGAAAPTVVADSLAFPTGVAAAPGGAVLVADTFNGVVRRIDGGGGRTTVAGGGTSGSVCGGDGGPATATPLSPPTAVAVGPGGELYVADAGAGRVVRVGTDGRLTTVALATFPSALAIAPGGDLLVADSFAGTVVRVASPATAFTAGVDRVAGADRYATAAALSARLFAAGAPVAFVATGDAFPDALGAAGAAGAAGGPVLLTRRDSLPDVTSAELQRLGPARVVVLGGTAAVSDAVADAVARAAGVGGVERRAGADRYDTAAALSAAAFPQASTAVVVSGEAFPDALSGGAAASLAGAPVLLTRRDALPDRTADELGRLHPSRVLVVGGTGAVSAAVESAIRAAAGGGDVERLAGADRFDTSAAVAARVTSASTVLVATGLAFPDGLAAAAAAKKAGGPVLLVPCFEVPDPVRAARARLGPAPALVVGGPAAVPAMAATRISSPPPVLPAAG